MLTVVMLTPTSSTARTSQPLLAAPALQGIYVVPLQEYFGVGRGAVSWLASIWMTFLIFWSLVHGWLADNFGR
jgi:hypothetical protein